jgi:hypothetical protein
MYGLQPSARHCPIWQRSFDIETRRRRLDHHFSFALSYLLGRYAETLPSRIFCRAVRCRGACAKRLFVGSAVDTTAATLTHQFSAKR